MPHTRSTSPKIIPPNPEDKVTVDSMIERMKKAQEYDEKLRYLRDIREGLVASNTKIAEKIREIDALILDYMKLKKGIE